MVAPAGFEPTSGGSEPPMLGHYTKGLKKHLHQIQCFDQKKIFDTLKEMMIANKRKIELKRSEKKGDINAWIC